MHKTLLILSLAAILFTGADEISAQQKERSFEATIGTQLLKIQDHNFSPMVYQGFSFSPALGLTTETPAYIDALVVQYITGTSHPRVKGSRNSTSASIKGGSINWMHVRKLSPLGSAKTGIYLGGVFNSSLIHYEREYYGQDSYYFYQSSLGPSFRLSHPLKIKGINLVLSSQFDFALLSYAVYPSYSSPLPDRLLDKDANDLKVIDFFTGGKFLTVNRFQRVNNLICLACTLNSKIAIEINYNWELIHVVRQNDFYKAGHDINLSIVFNHLAL